ncbi:MAG: hypothetical protein AAGU75_07630 [Bacillota bacterium]
MNKITTKTVATGGVFLALSIATLFGATTVPGIELTLYTFSSFYAAFIIIEISTRAAWLFYFASVLLTFAILPNKGALIPYAIFFGLYGIVKYYIENFKKINQLVEIILKLLFCNIIFALGYIFFKELFLGTIQLPDVALPFIIIGAQVFFLAYDYIFTLIIGFYMKRRPKA